MWGEHAEISHCRDCGGGVRADGHRHPAAQAGAGGEQPPAGVVSATPVSGTPHLKASDNNPIQQIRQLVQCGNTMYGVGSFSEIVKGSTTYTRENIFSFSATKPYTVTSWAPNIVGTEGTTSDASDAVNTIAFVNGNCADAYIGGKFTSINGTAVAEHRRDRHHHRQRGGRLRDQGVRRGADHGRRGQSPAGRRQLRRGER